MTSPSPSSATSPGWRPGLVALDIDGTLVDFDGTLPPTIHQAVQRVLAAGVPVVLATGRAWHGTAPVFDALGLPPGPAVCSNGAIVVSYPPLAVQRQVTFDPRPAIELVQRLAPDALLAVEEVGGYRLTGHFPDGDLTGEMVIQSAEELSARPVTRIIVRDPSSDDQQFIAMAEQLGLHGVSYFIGYSAWLDICPEGVSKASALAEVAEQFGVAQAEVLALGDGRNDIEMLTWAGRGVALGDAPEAVRAVADHVTGGFLDGGTVEELDRWF